MFILQIIRLNSLLAPGASFPIIFWTFISAYMDVLAGKQLDYFVNYVLQKRKGGIVTCTENIIKYSPGFLHQLTVCFLAGFGDHVIRNLCFFSGKTTQPGISRNGSAAVPWHFYFRNNGDKMFRGIIHYFPDLVLCVIASIGRIVISLARVPANNGAVAPCSHFCESWIFF